MKTIVIQITVPDGAQVQVATAGVEDDFEHEPLPPHPGEEVPAFRGAATQPMQVAQVCPVHRVAWKTVPAGVSKKTGKPYSEFRACPEQGCNERP